jgi:dihydroneopterin aldolase
MTIGIHNLGVRAVIGILPHERNAPQRLHINATIIYDYSGDMENYVDYATAIELIEQRLKEARFGLIETALETITAELMALSESIQSVTLSIEKPDIFPHAAVSVTHTLK